MSAEKEELSVILEASNELAESNNDQQDAIVKEEEVITKRKTELTTTKQVETRVKRQVKFEDGKVIEDSGPIVSTATTEDTDKVESEQVERKAIPTSGDVTDGPKALEYNNEEVSSLKQNFPMNSTDNTKKTIAAVRDDGLIREVKENRVVSREDTIELTEVEDVRHLGDFSDAAYVKAVNSGSENIEKILLSTDAQLSLLPVGPRLIKNIVNKHKTVDSEDTELKFIRQPDGTLVTEQKKTTEHEEILDEDLPPNNDRQSTGSQEKVLNHKESSQRFVKQRAEQEVEYVSDGKVIAKEMRYAAENDYMERDGSKEEETDWDSLSDRVKKTRRIAQKTLMQKQRAENGERKDALTNRPLDFDKEEETRRKETYKWLDNHFGSDSTSRDESTISDIVVEPTKKSYFNVTIKANGNQGSTNNLHNVNTSSSSSIANNINNNIKTSTLTRQSNNNNNAHFSNDKLTSTAKVYVPERESTPKKFFQGISDWSERKEPPKAFVGTPLGSKAFRDELSNTLERKQKAIQHMNSNNNSFEESKYRSKSQDLLKSQKEDLGYLSGSRTDLRNATPSKKYTNDDYAVPMKKKITTNGLLHREDSGFRESKEDLRSPPHREDSFREEAKQVSIQRDDSAYVSSSTYFTSPRSPRRPRSPVIKTPDSGVRSPTPTNDFESDEINQIQPPTVPQRKKNIEKKIRVHTKNEDYVNYPAKPRRDPPIDYSPPPRSRSTSPLPPIHHVYHDRKSFQKTRFSSPPSTPTPTSTIVRSSQTQTQQSSLTKKKSLGSSISNSLRKIVGKIRSVSAERKSKSKTPVKRSPSPISPITRHKSVSHLPSSSYQRTDYVIDGHIGNGMKFRAPSTSTQASTNFRRERTFDHIERGSSTTDNEMPITSERVTHHTQKKTLITSPKQRYYLGENPYSGGALFGKENKGHHHNGESEIVKQKNHYNYSAARRQRSEEPRMNSNSTSTLGRFSKSTNRLTSHESSSSYRNGNGYISAALQESNDNYRSSQTLPRKLDHKTHKPISQSTINVSIVNNVKHPLQNTGPTKPARTYKSLQRSKSFNVHGMNGTNDPSPIYMEKLTNNNYRNYQNSHHNYNRDATESPHRVITTTTHHTKIYKSTPQLIDPLSDIKLKSPSIVNLISRSTKDLTSLNDHHYIDRRYNASPFRSTPEPRKNGYMKSHFDEDEIVSKNIKFVERESLGSKGSSRSSPIVTKDSPVGILRRGSNSTDNENYSETYKYQTKSSDPSNPTVTDTVETFTKKVIPEEIDPRTKKETTIERHEIKKITKSQNFSGSPSPPNLKYYDVNHNRNGNVVIELKNNY